MNGPKRLLYNRLRTLRTCRRILEVVQSGACRQHDVTTLHGGCVEHRAHVTRRDGANLRQLGGVTNYDTAGVAHEPELLVNDAHRLTGHIQGRLSALDPFLGVQIVVYRTAFL